MLEYLCLFDLKISNVGDFYYLFLRKLIKINKIKANHSQKEHIVYAIGFPSKCEVNKKLEKKDYYFKHPNNF